MRSTWRLCSSSTMSMKSMMMMPPRLRDQLPRGGLRGFQIRLVHRFFEIAVTEKGPGVDVDRGHGLGLVDNQVSTGLQWHFLLERTLNLVFDAIQIEDRPLPG